MKPKSRYLYQSPFFTFIWVAGCAAVFLLVWILMSWDEWRRGGSNHLIKGIASVAGILGYFLFSLSLFLASRLKILEKWIGGLDQVYQVHHKIGLWGFYLLLIHPWISALKWLPQNFTRFILFIFPFHHRISVNFGSVAFWLMLFIIVVTVFKLFPYDKWKLTHRFMSLVFVFASLHFLFSKNRFDPSFGSLALLFIPMGLGMIGILNKQVLIPLAFRGPKIEIVETNKLNRNVIQIQFKPVDKPFEFVPGQYAFFSFEGAFTREQHPFTICQGASPHPYILVKARGDFTRSLYENMKPGCYGYVEGPYGQFDYKKGGQEQIWIAGGIGVVPFLCWVQEMEQTDLWKRSIHFFYCVHETEDALYSNEFEQISDKNENFQYTLFCTEKHCRLSIQEMRKTIGAFKEKEIYMCGPRRLTRDFTNQFLQEGVKRQHIHFEDFEFF